jgi:ankyrin repeat protein
MATLSTEDPLAVAVVDAIHSGDVPALRRLLDQHQDLATTRIGDDDPEGMSRTLLHVATDWPGHFPGGPITVAALVGAGADVNARFGGPHAETPLHWAASSDDVAVIDALLDAGADIEAPGAVIAGGTPLADATAFGQWKAARRLIERGAKTNYFADASLGPIDNLHDYFGGATAPDPDQVADAFWAACHGGQLEAAKYLLDRGAALNWLPGWEELTPLDAAARSGASDVITWLHGVGARTASDLRGN